MKGRDRSTGWYRSLIPVCLLAAAIVMAGCAGTASQAVTATVTPAFAPGQLLQLAGDVTGNGFMPPGVPRGTIDTVTFAISVVPGVRGINLDNLTVIYADAIRTTTLTPVKGLNGTPEPGQWGITGFINPYGPATHRLDLDKQAIITVSLKNYIVPNQLFRLVVKPAEGQALTITRVAPGRIVAGVNILEPA